MRKVSTINPEFSQNSALNYQTCETGRNIGSVNVPYGTHRRSFPPSLFRLKTEVNRPPKSCGYLERDDGKRLKFNP